MPGRLFRPSVCAGLLFLAVSGTLRAGDGSSEFLDAYHFEGFPAALALRVRPASALPFRNVRATRTALRGMNDSIVLAVQARQDLDRLTIAAFPAPLGGEKSPEKGPTEEAPLRCDILVVTRTLRSAGRRSPFLRILLDRAPVLREGEDAWIPELLVHDREAFLSERHSIRAGGSFPVGEPGPARAGSLKKGEIAYFVLRYRVSREAAPGEYRIRLDVDPGGGSLGVSVRVLDALLPPHGRHLCLSAEFDEPRHLRALADAGLTFMRTREASRWPGREKRFKELRSWGVMGISQHLPPRERKEVESLPGCPVLYFYGIDEPQPKPGRGRDGWSRMADHIRKSRGIHSLGGRVGTSLPFELAESLGRRNGKVYEFVKKFGVRDAFEPLDWANLPMGLQRVLYGREATMRIEEEDGPPGGFWEYVRTLQAERDSGAVDPETDRPVSKRKRLETCYFPLGFMRDPFFARWAFGALAATSEIDGVFAWTAMRPRGRDFFDDGDGPDALVALPSDDGIVPTYCFEAMRAGINDLRIIALLRSREDAEVEALLKPWRAPLRDGKRLDLLVGEAGLAELRTRLLKRLE